MPNLTKLTRTTVPVSESTVSKVIGMLIQPRQLIGIGAPFLIFGKVTLPAALAKCFVVGIVGRLQGSRHIDPVGVTNVSASSCVGLAAANRIICGSNSIFEQAVHFIELTLGNGNWVLHDAPVIGIGAVVWTCRRAWAYN